MSAELTVAVAVATPMLAFLGVLVAQAITRRGAVELDLWRRREETMRMLRWAVEAAASGRTAFSAAGLVTLTELVDAEMLQPEDAVLVGAVRDVVVSTVTDMIYADHDPATYAEGEIVATTEDEGDG